MIIQEALKKCGWTDELISHFTGQGLEAIDDEMAYQETTFLIDNATLFLNDNSKKDTTAFLVK